MESLEYTPILDSGNMLKTRSLLNDLEKKGQPRSTFCFDKTCPERHMHQDIYPKRMYFLGLLHIKHAEIAQIRQKCII